MFKKIYQNVMQELEQGLPQWLTYHNPEHTKYVLHQAERIAIYENVKGRDLLLVKVAALYHDIGFLIQSEDHEILGCKRAAEDLKKEDFTAEEVSQVCDMIKVTQIPQKPKNLLEKIVADADLEYLGTENFNAFSSNLYRELRHLQPDLTLREWDEIQIKFLTGHSYHTTFCKQHRAPVKEKNLEMVKKRVLAYEG